MYNGQCETATQWASKTSVPSLSIDRPIGEGKDPRIGYHMLVLNVNVGGEPCGPWVELDILAVGKQVATMREAHVHWASIEPDRGD